MVFVPGEIPRRGVFAHWGKGSGSAKLELVFPGGRYGIRKRLVSADLIPLAEAHVALEQGPVGRPGRRMLGRRQPHALPQQPHRFGRPVQALQAQSQRVARAYGIAAREVTEPEGVGEALGWFWEDPMEASLLRVEIPMLLSVYPNVPFGAPLDAMAGRADLEPVGSPPSRAAVVAPGR